MAPAALHRRASLLPFGCGWRAVVIDHPPGSGGIDDPGLQLVGLMPRQEHMQHRVIGASLPCCIAHLFLAAAPAIAYPDHHLSL
ncbi:MAG: hypothetical protein ERJ68_09065 [Aphanocapsa feldmannii 277cI]|uniref:Uncharacterized protein n=1 Tax=Aphanocapsa feldmannii 277cI TaxID=2507554 RepID=A0A524RRK6_9CHRO|nr:MAG: hypothetical protein ERJ68_09065 [Aphanocapsa feldmannii 277cI]